MKKTKTDYQKFESTMSRIASEEEKRRKQLAEDKIRKKNVIERLQSEEIQTAFMEAVKNRRKEIMKEKARAGNKGTDKRIA